jgi:hypothetical protein
MKRIYSLIVRYTDAVIAPFSQNFARVLAEEWGPARLSGRNLTVKAGGPGD